MATSTIKNITPKFVTKTATTDGVGQVADTDIYNIGNKLISIYAISPSYATIRVAPYANIPYVMYFNDARTGNTLANASVSYRYAYME